MAKYKVNIHYKGGYPFVIEAASEEEAEQKAEEMFDALSDADLVANLADISVDDVWEVSEHNEV